MGKDLVIACAVGDLQWVKLCVDKGANPKFINSEGWSALHMAAMNAKLDCMKFLIENLKIDVDISSETGWSPLHLASRAKPEPAALDCVTYLVSKGADVNRVNDMGISSVHQAVSANNLQCLSTLVKNGARVACTDKRGLLPIDVAKVWGHSECSKYLENVMWFEKKREDEAMRRKWVLEHKKILDEEIKKYSDAKRSDRVQQAYKSWIDKKRCASPKLPSHSEARARPLTCFKEEIIHDFHRRRLSQNVKDKIPTPKTHQYSPRLQLERVKKIQELRSMITSRDATRDSHSQHKSRDVISKLRDVTPPSKPRDAKSHSAVRPRSPEEQSAPESNGNTAAIIYQTHYRISKLAEPKLNTCKRKRRKRKTVRTPADYSPNLYFPLKVDNYFKQSPTSSTPDSGFVEEPCSPLTNDINLIKADDHAKLEIVSVHSEESQSEKLAEIFSNALEKSDIGSKTVRFSDNVFYNTEHGSVSFGNTFNQLRSCIKVKNLHLHAN